MSYRSSTINISGGSPGSFTTLTVSGTSTLTGNVGIGGAAFASAKLMLSGTAPASGTLSFGHYSGLTLDPTVTSSAYLNYTVPAIATGGTVGVLAHYFVAQGVFTGAATNQYGFAVGSTMTGATNNYGFHSAIASGANRWNFYAAGTAPNYFAGYVQCAGVVTVGSGSATIAGGSQANNITFGSTNQIGIYFGSGAPTVSAGKGSLYLRSDGSTVNDRMYVNTDGGTTWTAVVTVA